MQMPWCVEAPTALSTREAQVNSTARCQLTPVRRAVKNKTGNNKPAKTRMQGRSGCKDTSVRHHRQKAGEGNGTHSSVLAWRIPGTGEPGGLPSMGSHGVGHD